MKEQSQKAARARLAAGELTLLSGQLEAWRASKPYSGAPMPQNLWQLATKAAGKFGVAEVSRALKLGYMQLKRRCQQPQKPKVQKGAVNFVELFTPPVATFSAAPMQGTCTVELNNGRGAKMVVHLSAETLHSGLSALSADFWRAP